MTRTLYYPTMRLKLKGTKFHVLFQQKNINLDDYDGEIHHFPEFTLIPGFVQTHVHLCQTLFRGLADDLLLLDWLQKKIFPFENAHSENSLSTSVKLVLMNFFSVEQQLSWIWVLCVSRKLFLKN